MRLPRAAWTAIEATTLAVVAFWIVVVAPPLVHHAHGAVFVWLRASGSCGLFALLIAALAGGEGWVGWLLARRPLVALGQASFAFYLVHVTVMRALRFHFGEGPGALSAFELSLGLAFLLHHGVEIPMRARVLALGAQRAAALRPRRAAPADASADAAA